MAAPSAKHLSYGSARIPGFPAMQKTSAEVIVVGGGLGGLQAAYEAQQAGMTCLVLEQDDVLGGYWNWNAHYAGVDDGHHPKTTGVLRELGLLPDLLDATDVQNQETACTGDLSSLDANDRRSYTRVRDNLESLSQRVEVLEPSKHLLQFGSMTVKELVQSHGATQAVLKMADQWTSALFGVSANLVAALTFLLQCRTHGGFLQSLEAGRMFRLGADLHMSIAAKLVPGSVHLSQKVEHLDQTAGNKVVLTTQEGGVFQCTKVILALPLSDYRGLKITLEFIGDKQWLWTTDLLKEAHSLPVPARHLKDIEQDQWVPEGNIHFAGSETSNIWRGHIEGALVAGGRAVQDVLHELQPHAEVLVARL